MRPEAIYPQKFGSGIPNPIGPATFRGVGGEIRYVSVFFEVYHPHYHDPDQATKHTGKLGSTSNQEVTIQH